MRLCVDHDDRNDNYIHETPRYQDPKFKWSNNHFDEVTLFRRKRNLFDLYVEQEYQSVKRGTIVMFNCPIDRLPKTAQFTRGLYHKISREGVVFSSYVKSSDKSLKLEPLLNDLHISKVTDKIEISMDDLLVARLQKDHARELHKAKKTEKRKKKDPTSTEQADTSKSTGCEDFKANGETA